MRLKKYEYLTCIIFWYVLSFLHFSLFLYTYFPVKTKSSTTALIPPKFLNGYSLNVEKNYYKAEVDRIILIVIDALRYDFVTEAYMPYTYSQINHSESCLLPARVESPTVTMPRIKAMTTGSVPQFIDLILNFGSKEITEDSFLHRAKAEGKKIIFYGDDTWLKLFPDMFLRSEGTTSFYVTDFTEVDNNVTRHLKTELQRDDWDLLLLHYLGLDHIGHVHGPFHPLIGKKLQEMDDIIRNIHTTIRNQDKKSVILICGDHGMRDAGGHGGSSDPETLVPLIFFGVFCNAKQKPEISQVDIAPTISALMGLNLPSDNIGKIILEVMNPKIEHLLYVLHYNAWNLFQKDLKYFNKFGNVFDKHYEFLKNSKFNPRSIIAEYEYKITEISNMLIKNSTIQNVPLLYFSFIALFVNLFALLLLKHRTFFVNISLITLIFTIVLFYFHDYSFVPYISFLYCIYLLLIILTKIPNLCSLILRFKTSPISLFLFLGTFLRTILLISSSYIEEEHQTWYYFWGTATVLGAYEEIKFKSGNNTALWIVLFAGLRVFRHLNRIGLQDTSSDFSKWLQLPENTIWLSIVFIIGLIGTATCCKRIFQTDKVLNILSILTTLTILWYRHAFHYDAHTVFQARIAMILIIVVGCLSYFKYKEMFKSLSVMWILWMSLLMRSYNVILIPVCFEASQILFKLIYCKNNLLFLHVWLAYVLFHCQGLCNSLSSIDISPGYVGLTEFSLFLTSFQVICHTYTFHILSLLLLFSRSNFYEHVKMLHFLIFFRLFNIVWYCFCMLCHRQHLFIWSVFSPKLIIEACHSALLLAALLIYVLIVICTKKEKI